MNGFTTLAVGNGYLQRAAAFALSARRFGYPTILMYKDVDVSQYAPLFHQTVDVSRAQVVNDRRPCAIWELKKYCYALTEAFECCAFCDADSLVIKDPASVFTLTETVHTPGAKTLTAEMRWAVPPIIESTVELARQIGITQPIQTLNGGFLVWRRGVSAEEWFCEFDDLFEQIHAIYQPRGKHGVRDELCLALAFARRGIHLPKTDSSIGIWDAHNLVLSIENQEFECVKGYYWQGHRFRPCIAHFGGSTIGKRYRECVHFLTSGGEANLPLFLEDTTVGRPSPNLRDRARFNSYSVSKKEAEWLASFVREHGIKHVLEFGPGASTWYFADAGCEVYSLEYQEKWYQHYRRQFAGVDNVRIIKYENRSAITVPTLDRETFDLGFVDSPEGSAYQQFSRINACEFVAQRAGIWMLHDARRKGEQNTLQLFEKKGWTVQIIDSETKIGVVRRASDAPASQNATERPRAYDFAHWNTLPKVSCQCITYGRPHLLNEAVESFLRQDYPGEKELVILNDHADVLLEESEIPEVRVFNIKARFRSIGEKRNACCALCNGEIIFPWDDDDISLPWRISLTIERMVNHHYFKPRQLWYWANGSVSVRKAVAHAMGGWSKELFDEVRGYPHIQSGQDQAIENLFQATGKRQLGTLSVAELFYVYRFPGTQSYHLSAFGYGKGLDGAEKHVNARVKPGSYLITPHWSTDYLALTSIHSADQ